MEKALQMIAAQQAEMKKSTAPWYVAEQLKDIVRTTPGAAELVAQDLTVKDMAITECEKKIAEFAKKHKAGNVGVCGPADADRIIREFYGLPAASSAPGPAPIQSVEQPAPAPAPAAEDKPKPQRQTLNLLDFM